MNEEQGLEAYESEIQSRKSEIERVEYNLDWAVKDWIEAVEGRLIAGSSDARICGVSTDSRTVSAGQLFVALRGPNHDGHDFIREAVGKGAAAVMVSRTDGSGTDGAVAVIAVEDTLAALGKLAAAWRARFTPMVAALSGSSGKTTTKDILRHMAEPSGGLVTEGNLNNRIGVPLTVFRLEAGHPVAVFELAMNQPGELAILTEIVRPEIVALINVGSAHMGHFATREDLRAAKAELITHAPKDAVIVLNADCYQCQRIAQDHCAGRDVAWFGMTEPAHFRAEEIQVVGSAGDPPEEFGYRFDLVYPEGRQTVTLRAFGRHNISNVLCATTLAYLLEIELDHIFAGIEAFRAGWMRSEILPMGRVTVIADCYNANPDSVEAALDGLVEFAGSRRRIFVMADMLELGEDAPMAHRVIGQEVAERGIALFATTGDLAQWSSWEASRMGVRAGHFETKEQLVRALAEEIRPGDVVLVKGSRLMALEEVVARLKELV
jgi:UDP-N-acetylmuramoyl-tripeptide--D-alanyl-D-alanine ligase